MSNLRPIVQIKYISPEIIKEWQRWNLKASDKNNNNTDLCFNCES